jgi:copper chaperone CopZ
MSLAEPDHPKHMACRVAPVGKEVDADQLARAETVVLLVRGMGCPACALRVRNGLLQVEGVVGVNVALLHGLAKVWYDPERLQPETLPDLLPAVADDGWHHYTAHILAL